MSISIQEILTQAVGFLILVFVMTRLFWKPVLGALLTRQEKIKTDIEKIDASKKEIEALKVEYTAHLKKIDDEARSKIQDAIEEGRRVAREIQEKARHEAQTAFDKSKENISMELEKARISLRREIAGLALQVAEKVVQEKMTGEKNQEKALQIIEELEKAL